jgi:hypothetical protein
MLPSFRLIAATFLCGFVVMFAGLRMAASLNDIHEALPVMAAHAAPISVSPSADREARRGVSSVPVMYDLRFAVSPASPTLVRAAPAVMERFAPVMPLAILPAEIFPKEDVATAESAEPIPLPDIAVAAIDPDAGSVQPPAAAAEPPAAEIEAAATEPPSTTEAAAIEPPVVAPEATDSTASIDAPAPDAAPPDAAAVPMPVARPLEAKLAPKAVAKPKPRKPRVRTARRATSADPTFDINNPISQPFDNQPQ